VSLESSYTWTFCSCFTSFGYSDFSHVLYFIWLRWIDCYTLPRKLIIFSDRLNSDTIYRLTCRSCLIGVCKVTVTFNFIVSVKMTTLYLLFSIHIASSSISILLYCGYVLLKKCFYKLMLSRLLFSFSMHVLLMGSFKYVFKVIIIENFN